MCFIVRTRYYTKAQRVLLQYQHMASFQGIHTDCSLIIQQLATVLKQQFSNKEVGDLLLLI